MPIDWKELSALKSGDAFGMAEALKRRGDPWKSIGTVGKQRLPAIGAEGAGRMNGVPAAACPDGSAFRRGDSRRYEWAYEPKWDGFRCIAFRDR